jgi:hypothetical protein
LTPLTGDEEGPCSQSFADWLTYVKRLGRLSFDEDEGRGLGLTSEPEVVEKDPDGATA